MISHLIRTRTSTVTWCGRPVTYRAGWRGVEKLLTTVLKSATTCRRCLAAERKWRKKHNETP